METNIISERPPPNSGQIALGASLSVVICVSVGGNLLVCIAVCRDRTLRKVNNSLYVSLAIADLLLSVLVMPFGVAQEITGSWDFLSHFCNVWLSLDVMCCTASILNICAIALDRYMHVRDPFRYASRMTRPTFVLLIGLIWLCSVIISFLPIHLGWHMDYGIPVVENVTVCFLDLNPTYAVLSSTVSFFLPCAALLVLYARLYKHARQHALSIKLSKGLVDQHSTSVSTVGSPEKRRTGRLTRTMSGRSRKVRRWSASDHKAAVTLGVIMGTFVICWMPFFIVNVIQTICQCVSQSLFNLVTWLGYFNSCINPIIYSLFNLEFRNAFRRILCHLLPRNSSCCSLLGGRTPSTYRSASSANGTGGVDYTPTHMRAHRYSPLLHRKHHQHNTRNGSPARICLLPMPSEMASVCLETTTLGQFDNPVDSSSPGTSPMHDAGDTPSTAGMTVIFNSGNVEDSDSIINTGPLLLQQNGKESLLSSNELFLIKNDVNYTTT